MTKLKTTITVGIVGVAAAFAFTGCSKSSTTTDAPSPNISIPSELPSIDSGGGAVGGKPNGWPSDVPVPATLALQGSGSISTATTGAWLGEGDIKAIQSQLTTDFKANGFTSNTSFGGGDTGGVTLWEKGTQKVQVTVAQQDGKVAVSETIVNT